MQKAKTALGSFAATVRNTFGCANASGNVIGNDDKTNFMVGTAKDGCSSGSEQSAFVEIDLLRNGLNRQRKFPDNSIRTAKYTLLTSLPLSLLYQFHKISNLYFLLVMIITLVPGASPTNPFSSIVPLCIVLGAGILKDIWEDYKRRKADQKANEVIVYVLRARTELPSNGVTSHGSAATSSSDGGAAEAHRVKDPAKKGKVHGAHNCQQKLLRWWQDVAHVFSRPDSRTGDTMVRRSNRSHDGDGMDVLDEVEMSTDGRGCGTSKAAPTASNLRYAPVQSRGSTTPVAAAEPVVTFHPVRSCDVYPGDVMLFRLGEEVKADCLILNTSLPDGLAYVETSNLDGETNAKTRRAKIQTVEALGTVEDVVEQALGVSASDAAAVQARMSSTATGPPDAWGGSGETTAPTKVYVDCCDALGGGNTARVTDRLMNTSIEETAVTNPRRLNVPLTTTSSAALVKGAEQPVLSAKAAARNGDVMTFPTAIFESIPSLEDLSNSSSPHQHGLQTSVYQPYEEREATEHYLAGAARERSAARLYKHHVRCFSDPQQHFRHFVSPRTGGIPLSRSYAYLGVAESETLHNRADHVTPDITPKRILHQRLMTLNDRLAEEGQLPMPPQLQQLSEQYERTVHSRTNSAGGHLLPLVCTSALHETSSHVWPNDAANRTGESESVFAKDATSHPPHISGELQQKSASDPQPREGAGDGPCSPSCGCSALDRPLVAHDEPLHGSGSATAAAPGSPPASGVVLVSCPPTPDLSIWFGQLRLPTGEMVPLGIDQFIPRGCVIRNTDWVLGAAVYTGCHTKMLLNLRPKPHKITSTTRRLNHLNVFFVILNQVLMLLLCGLAIWSKHRLLRKVPGAKSDHSTWYIQWNLERYSDSFLFWWRYLTNFVLVSYLIPMSLYVTLEFNKAMQMLQIAADKRMAVFDEFTGAIKKARPKTSELNSQLGHVRYIFTDKTGTLTENLMTYVGGIVNGHTHNEMQKPGGIGLALLRRRAAHVPTSVLPSAMDPGGEPSLRHDHHHHINFSLDKEAQTLDADIEDNSVGMQGVSSLTSAEPAADKSSSGANGGSDYNTPAHPLQGVAAMMASHLVVADGDKAATRHRDNQGPAQTIAAISNSVAQGAISYILPRVLSDGGATQPCADDESARAALRHAIQEAHQHTTSSRSVPLFADGALGNGGVGSAAPGADGSGPGGFGCSPGLRNVSEAVLERDPLFCYLRAIALCHSVVCFPVDAGSGGNGREAKQAAKKDNGAPQDTKKRKRRHRHHHNQEGDSAGKRMPKRRRRSSASTVGPVPSAVHHQRSREAAHPESEVVPLSTVLSLTEISGGNFVEIPYAVPAGPGTCEDCELCTAGGANSSRSHNLPAHGHVTCASAAPLMKAASTDGRSHYQHYHHQTSATSMALLHGRTSSASWYQNRYLNRTLHSRNFSAQTINDGTGRGRQLNRGPSSGSASGCLGQAAAPAVVGGSAAASASIGITDLEQFIDRSKIYEGQSLDEIGLVNAARENGFSLFERTTRQMYVKALGRVLCYDIVAELEFTPQRKLMSILLQRRPDLDAEAVTTSLAAGTSAHYHRRAPENAAAGAVTAVGGGKSPKPFADIASRVLPDGGAASQSNKDAQLPRVQTRSPFTSFMATDVPPPLLGQSTALSSRATLPGKAEKQQETEGGNKSTDAAVTRVLLPHNAPLRPPSSGAQHLLHQSSLGEMSLYHDCLGSSTDLGFAATAGVLSSKPGKYLLLVKGADSSMIGIVNMQKRANVRAKDKMQKELDAMSQLGLRTLILGQRYLSEEEVREWLPIFNNAQCAMQDRSEKLHEAYALLERDIDIVGATAVEDKLQEEVPQTLEFCIQASIVVWMLTGDKRETAVTIAQTSGLISIGCADYVCHLDLSDILEEEALMLQQQRYKEQRQLKTNDGSLGEPSPLSESSSDAENALQLSEVSMTTRAYLSASSDTQSPQQQNTCPTQVGSTDRTFSTGSPRYETVGTSAGDRHRGAESSTTVDAAQSFLTRKCTRIEEQLRTAEDKCNEGQEVFNAHVVVIVVDGKTLDFIFEDSDRARRFFLLGSRCRSAVCCRMTPLQKAKVVRMFKRNTNAVVLAIGDGANDVSMIQESSIGVGIMGLEGSQAELASDYALPKFRFLKRLLFVHGRFSVFREAHCVVFSLYKNVIVTVGMVSYQFFVGFSGQTLIDSWLLALFSVFFCSLQPLMIGILDKDVEDELAESLPKLYPPLSREFMYFSFPYIFKWLADGLIEGLLFFFVLMYTVGVQDNLYTYMTAAIEDYGATFFTMLVLVADLRAGTLVTYYMIPFALVIGLGLILLPTIEFLYSSLNDLADSNWFVRVAHELYSTSGKFWLMLFFACGVLILFTMALNMYIQLFAPWQNAGFAMRAARRSHHRIPYTCTKESLKAEYARLLARYEELTKAQQQPKEAAVEGSNAKGTAPTVTTAPAAAAVPTTEKARVTVAR
ncbi:phospholipid transporting ATPase-like protein, putative [Leishmania panamensis]|uniref:Phospholipid transporting ATPase-like protein, putative n=1 Tax=Leishmania panamensis TaxID=5679 RepID=A0A088RJL9_LEIPA|nr:phospholipid transporting ATPase-like protein, putative [Leishmania panamensis]AIN96005.1 phospholipid transporting ATPase-like protein, putative [Leishmania panamensis]